MKQLALGIPNLRSRLLAAAVTFAFAGYAAGWRLGRRATSDFVDTFLVGAIAP